tara:strand:- start:366 stop:749 length:384 start_codon:yes stop_codon:yes gene_type:complete
LERAKFSHYSDIPKGLWRWKNFSPVEIACRHCGEIVLDEKFMDGLQRARELINRPVRVNCAYRCPTHNAFVGGAPMSRHKIGDAVDISIRTISKELVHNCLVDGGFQGFGLRYNTFIHADMGRKRSW